jgi:hypothetical protein
MKTSWAHRAGAVMAVLLLSASIARAAGTQLLVSNVQAQQRQFTAIWDVTYDLETVGGIVATVSLSLSTDSGATYPNLCATVTGDIGVGVLPGVGKHIVWNAGADFPGLSSAACQLRVTADDDQVPCVDISGSWISSPGSISWVISQSDCEITAGGITSGGGGASLTASISDNNVVSGIWVESSSVCAGTRQFSLTLNVNAAGTVMTSASSVSGFNCPGPDSLSEWESMDFGVVTFVRQSK